MRKEDEKEESKELIAAKHRLLNKKNILGLSIVILVFLVVTFTMILKSENVDSGAVILKPKDIENEAKKVWNDVFSSVSPTSDGGYIAVGCTVDRDLDHIMCTDVYEEDAIIAKYNEKGEISWKKYLNARYNDEYNSVQQTSDGGYITAGYIVGGGNHLTGKPEWYDAIIAKYSSSGKLIWDKRYGTNSKNEQFSAVSQTSDGGYIAVGGKRKGYGEYDAVLVKYDESGQMKWTKSFGGNGYDYFNSVQQMNDGGYIAIGSSDDGKDPNDEMGGDEHALMVKFDSNGKVIWKNIFITDRFGYYLSEKQTSDGGYVAVGYCDTEYGFNSIIVKYNKNRKISWHKEFGGYGNDYFNSVEETSGGEYMVVGSSDATDGDLKGLNEKGTHAILVKFDKTGNVVEKNVLKGPLDSSFSRLERTSDGRYMIIGKLCNKDGGFNGKNATTVVLKYNNDLQASKQLVLQKEIDYHRDN